MHLWEPTQKNFPKQTPPRGSLPVTFLLQQSATLGKHACSTTNLKSLSTKISKFVTDQFCKLSSLLQLARGRHMGGVRPSCPFFTTFSARFHLELILYTIITEQENLNGCWLCCIDQNSLLFQFSSTRYFVFKLLYSFLCAIFSSSPSAQV